MKNTKYSLLSLVINSIAARVAPKHIEPARLPKTLGEYTLMKQLSTDNSGKTAKGMYKNSNGKYMFVKLLVANRFDYAYGTLNNELTLLSVIQEVMNRNRNNLPKKYANIQVAKVAFSEILPNSITLGVEWISGSTISKLSSKKQIAAYSLLSEYLDYLYGQMTQDEKARIAHRGIMSYILLYPIIFTRASQLHPQYRALLKRAAFTFIKLISSFIVHPPKLTLVHRDLHPENIMISKNKIHLIDLEFSVITFKELDYSVTLRHGWGRAHTVNKHFTKYLRRITSNNLRTNLLRIGIIYHGTMGLAGSNFDAKRKQAFAHYIQFGTHTNTI